MTAETASSVAERPADAAQPIGPIVPLIIGGAILLQTLDTNVVAVALPTMAASFHANVLALNITITSYIIGAAVFLPVSGWLADRFGARGVFRLAILAFAITSMLCGASQSLWQLVVARTLQGFAGSLLMPVGRLVLLKSCAKTDFVRMMSYQAIPALVGPLLGPLLGGLVISHVSWRWLFFINVPVAAAGVVLVSAFIPDVESDRTQEFDVASFVLAALTLAPLAYAFEALSQHTMPYFAIALLLALGTISGLFYWSHALRRSRNPILDLTLLRVPTFAVSTFGSFGLRLTIGATPFMLALLFQVGFRMSPVAAGSLIFSTALGAILMRTTATKIYSRFGFRRVLLAGGAFFAASFAAIGLLGADTAAWIIVLLLLVHGFVRSLALTGLNALAYAEILDHRMSAASTLAGVSQLMSQSIGVGIAASLIGILQFSAGDIQLRARDISPAFAVIGLITSLSLFAFMRLTGDAGSQLHRKAR